MDGWTAERETERGISCGPTEHKQPQLCKYVINLISYCWSVQEEPDDPEPRRSEGDQHGLTFNHKQTGSSQVASGSHLVLFSGFGVFC